MTGDKKEGVAKFIVGRRGVMPVDFPWSIGFVFVGVFSLVLSFTNPACAQSDVS